MTESNDMFRRVAVYTAIFGGYEDLLERESVADRNNADGADYYCFTDRTLRGRGWHVIEMAAPFPDDPVRSARLVKILGHSSLKGYDTWLWLDNRVRLKIAPELLVRDWLSRSDLALPAHDHRETVADEFKQVLRYGLDSPAVVRRQLAAYSSYANATLEQLPLWTAILARRNIDSVRELAECWAAEVLRHSRRDQLSIRYAMHRHPDVEVNVIRVRNRESELHTWLTEESFPRNSRLRLWSPHGAEYSVALHFFDDLRLTLRVRFKPASQWVRRMISRIGQP